MPNDIFPSKQLVKFTLYFQWQCPFSIELFFLRVIYLSLLLNSSLSFLPYKKASKKFVSVLLT